MRTSLEYVVQREEVYDFRTDKMVNRITSRGFQFCVTGCTMAEEHDKVIDSFYDFLKENNVESYGVMDYNTWEDAMRYDDEACYVYLDIPVKDVDEKAYVKELYKEWKQKR